MHWTKQSIVKQLKRLHRAKADLSYNAMSRRSQALVSAAAYHFASYRRAVEAAGINYAKVTRRPRWTRPAIISLIKRAYRRGLDLHWSAITRRRDELGRAAFAALQPRLFGCWDRALHAAGLDADVVSRYRKWDRNTVVFELRERRQNEEPLNSGATQRDDAGLHAAAIRHFGTYERALRAAKLNLPGVRLRQRWSRRRVTLELRRLARSRHPLTDSSLRRDEPALYAASVRLFKTFTAARRAASLDGRKKQSGGVKKRS